MGDIFAAGREPLTTCCALAIEQMERINLEGPHRRIEKQERLGTGIQKILLKEENCTRTTSILRDLLSALGRRNLNHQILG